MRTIAICNHKGGVGKTAVAMALAETLHAKGMKTLFVDLDQQRNATTDTKVDIAEDDVTVYDLLTSFDYTAKDAIKHYAHGDIIPGDILVAEAEVEISKLDTSLTMLADALESVSEDYDICIIDCPPSLGLVTRNAMVAANDIIVVVVPDTASIEGFEKICRVHSSIKRNKHLNPDLVLAGILINTYDRRGTLDRNADEVFPRIAESNHTKVFDTRIRKCIAIRKAQSRHMSILDFDARSSAAYDFEALATEYLEGVKSNG